MHILYGVLLLARRAWMMGLKENTPTGALALGSNQEAPFSQKRSGSLQVVAAGQEVKDIEN
jgi:hypothetical protein